MHKSANGVFFPYATTMTIGILHCRIPLPNVLRPQGIFPRTRQCGLLCGSTVKPWWHKVTQIFFLLFCDEGVQPEAHSGQTACPGDILDQLRRVGKLADQIGWYPLQVLRARGITIESISWALTDATATIVS